jgi:hypothetical protein
MWVALTLAAPVAARPLQRRLGPRLAVWQGELEFWARAAYGILPLYGAWITGAVLAYDCGLSGFSLADWLTNIGLCAVLLGALGLGLRSPRVAANLRTWFSPDGSWLGLFDEPRWAFYRGAAAVPFPAPVAAQTVGLILGGLEWLLRGGRPSRSTPPLVWAGLVRLGASAALFALTRNLWLILITQMVAVALITRAAAETAPSNP